MPSFIVPARNNPTLTAACLSTLLHSVQQLHWPCEFILIDDESPAGENILNVFRQHRAEAKGHDVKIIRSRKRQHYSGVFSIGLHHATRDPVFFISNDMLVTPAFLQALMEVSQRSPFIGIVRGTSNHTDSHPEHQVPINPQPKGFAEVDAFSRNIFRQYGNAFVEDQLLSGDAILVQRPLIQRIGVLDLRFFGYFGDVDYGLRAQLAGFRLVCAKGAWLFHQGGGHIWQEMALEKRGSDEVIARRLAMVDAAYQEFREKWTIATPEHWGAGDGVDPVGLLNTARANAQGVPLKYEFPAAVLGDLEFH
jgi:GT2 family glycosyltransferase